MSNNNQVTLNEMIDALEMVPNLSRADPTKVPTNILQRTPFVPPEINI